MLTLIINSPRRVFFIHLFCCWQPSWPGRAGAIRCPAFGLTVSQTTRITSIGARLLAAIILAGVLDARNRRHVAPGRECAARLRAIVASGFMASRQVSTAV
jgi:hypothetical protein